MADPESAKDSEPVATTTGGKAPPKRRRHWRRWILICLIFVTGLLAVARLMAPTLVRDYVNGVIDRHPLYDGQIGDVEIHLWRGAYTIKDIRLSKTTGNVPVPFFAARRLDLAIEWEALLNRRVVGRIGMETPELNFVDSDSEAKDQTGVGGPWLEMLQDLFPFKINSCVIRDGSIHFRALDKDVPVDVFINELQASIDNLSNIHDDLTPLVSTVKAKGLAMGQAEFQYEMKLDPFSYYPTFDLAIRLIGLDVTKVNALSRAYGAFDFEDGFFDLVVELECDEGQLQGYVKPLFRELTVLGLEQDLKEDNLIELFWEALIGGVTEILENQPRNQFATQIPLRGDLTRPQTELLTVLGNVLRNAFVRAYLPRLTGGVSDIDELEFGRGSVVDAKSVGSE